MSFRDDRLRLLDIVAAIGDIEKHVAGRPKATFADDGTAIDGVAYRLVIIGEAVASLPADLLAHEADIPWSEIKALRNRLVHAYFGIDLDILWGIVTTDLTPLRSAAERLLARSNSPPKRK